MNRLYHHHLSFIIILLLNTFILPAQRTYTYGYNSSGDRVYKLGDQQKSGSGDSTRIFSFSDTSTIIKQQTTLSSGEAVARTIPIYSSIYNIDTSCDVGKIPMNSSISPSGGRIYSIPLVTAAGYNFTPQLSLTYNSQSGDGVAGFGWSISGLSCITVRNKNHYYDGLTAPANYQHTNCSYVLDGQPLLQDSLAMELGYDWSTPTGHILVKKHTDASGRVLWFDALLPNGGKAIYGLTENEDEEENENTPEPELEPKPFYPLTRITDADGNIIKFKYHEPDSSLFYIDEVIYGTDSSASLKFHYQSRNDYNRYSHFATKPVHNSLLLTSIESFDDSGLITRDSLYHSTRYGTILLDSLGRSDRYAHRLNPIRFQYGNGALFDSGTFTLIDSVSQSSKVSSDSSLLFYRGKMVADDYNDGVVILPKRSNYKVLEIDTVDAQHFNHLYGTGYNQSDTITIYSDIHNRHCRYEPAGYGFFGIQVVDVDGDGRDEVIKMIIDCASPDNDNPMGTTTLTFQKLSFFSDGTYNRKYYNGLQFNRAIVEGSYVSPDHLFVGFGDFTGRGFVEAMVIDSAYSQGFNYIMNLKDSDWTYDTSSFKPYADSTVTLCLDIDGDGKTDVCHFNKYHLEIWRHHDMTDPSRHSLSLDNTIYGMGYFTAINIVAYGDVNGDGYMDFICRDPSGDAVRCYYFTGTGFSSQFLMNLNRHDDETFMLQDINGDGLADLLYIDGDAVDCYFNTPSSTTSPFTFSKWDFHIFGYKSNLVPGNTVRYNGMSHMLVLNGNRIESYKYTTNRSLLRSLTKITDSYSNTQENSYESIADMALNDLTYSADTTRHYSLADGYTRMRLPLNVLSAMRSHENGTNIVTDSTHFLYRDLVIHQTGLGFCGFGEVTSVNSALNTTDGRVTTTTRFNPENGGVATRVTKIWGSGANAVNQSMENGYSKVPRRWARFTPQLDWSYAYDPVTDIETSTSYRYDEYGFVTDTYAETAVGQSRTRSLGERPGIRTNRDASSYQLKMTAVTYDHIADAVGGNPRLLLGNATERLTMRSIDPNAGGEEPEPEEERRRESEAPQDYTVKETISYNGLTQHPSSVITDCQWSGDDGEDPGHGQEEEKAFGRLRRLSASSGGWTRLLEKRYTYDSFGNTTSEKSAAYGSDTFVGDSTVYDPYGRFVTAAMDALGLTTTYSNYNAFGKPETVTDPRGNTTTYYYDNWGRTFAAHYPDGRKDTTIVAWSTGLLSGTSGCAYKVTSSGNASPTTTVHYGAADREIKTDVVRFDGSTQITRKEYYTTGELARQTRPKKTSIIDTFLFTYTYDRYGRPVSLNENSGRQTTWSYDGRSTTTTKDGIASTTTLGCDDKPLSVTDAGGTVTYSYRADGQAETITAPGGMVTTLTYDDQGRRASISDPISGTHTESWSNNAGGGTTHTQSNAKGTVTTTTDAYGRTTNITRTANPGSSGAFNTSYTYGSYGELTEEYSNNGTGKSYSYDSKGRLYYIYDKAPDSHRLMTFYIYNANNGLLSTNFYYPDSSPSITMTHTYTRGYHTQSKVGSTIIWRLDAENQLGQPTQATTGSVTRTYSYNNNGLPTGRTMGTVMNFGYSYDAATGNMLSRSDNTRSITETFNYDALNRLTLMDDSQSGYRGISYDGVGNLDWIQNTGLYSFDDASHPHRLTSAYEPSSGILSGRGQDLVYTPYGRPHELSGDAGTITFTYDASGDRKKSYYEKGGEDIEAIITRYYMGPYECEIYDDLSGGGSKTSTSPDTDGASSSNNNGITTTRRLYLGGDAYSAPVVYAWSDNNAGTFYNIGRDVQGSITHIATMDGTLVAEYSYDPWGRMRDPATHALYAAHTEPSLMLGRGYTGHEHLNDHGLINMNARLYDPWLAIFLSPDPYVQSPDLSIGFNRYTYCLNNPLKYTDQSGELWLELGVMVLSAYWCGVMANTSADQPFNPLTWDWHNYQTYAAIYSGASMAGIFGGFAAMIHLQGVIPMGLAYAGSYFIANGITNFCNNKDFFENWAAATLYGFVVGAITGGLLAYQSGKNIWWGNEIKYNRTRWSFDNSNKPDYTIYYGVKDVGNKTDQDCVPSTLAEIEDFLGGDWKYEDFRSSLKVVTKEGTELSKEEYLKLLNHCCPLKVVDGFKS